MSTDTEHLLWIVEVVRASEVEYSDPEHELVAMCASRGDAEVIARRWALNDDYALVGIFDIDSGEIVLFKGEFSPGVTVA